MQIKERLGLSGIVLTVAVVASSLGAASVAAAASHRVQPGETLSEIAEVYGVPVSDLAAQNQVADYDLIFAGEDLVLPSTASSTSARQANGGGSELYAVRPGDSLWSIASMRRTTLELLIAANPDILDPNQIYVDQTIKLPTGGQATTTAASASSTQQTPDGDVPTLLTTYSHRYGIDPMLTKAIAWQESGWNQRMVSSSGALGVMQIMPATGDWIASDILGQRLDVANSAADNIHAGVAYLRYLMDRSPNAEIALAAYYQGPGSVQLHGMYPDTRRYVDNVLAIRSYIMLYGFPPRG